MKSLSAVGIFLSVLFFGTARGSGETVNFDQLSDSEVLTNQIAGAIFSNAIVLTAGISLNELEFPPSSNPNVVSDNGGPVGISFVSPISSFSAFFTYLVPLTIEGFDSSHNLIASSTSKFSSNLALSGDAGSSPNELLQIGAAAGISEILIGGDPSGGSFVMDDITYTSLILSPEPKAYSLSLFVLFICWLCRKKMVGRSV